MTNQQTLRRYRIVFLITSLAVVGISLANRLALDNYVDAMDRRVESQQMLVRLQSLLSIMLDAETGQRGYLLTGDPKFLEPYHRALQRIEPELDQLREAPEGQISNQCLESLVPSIQEKMARMAHSIQTYDQDGPEAARNLVKLGHGKRVMDEIRESIARQAQEIRNVTTLEAENARQATQFIALVSSLAALLGVSALWIGLATLQRLDRERRQALLELTRTNQGLEESVRIRTAELEEAHRQMLAEIASHHELANRLGFVQERLRVLEALPVPLLVVDARGLILQVNPHAERLLGYAREELIGQPVEILVPGDSRNAHVEYRTRYLAHPEPRPMGSRLDIRALHKSGQELAVEIMLTPLETAEGPQVIVGVIDIREQKRIQEAIQSALREKIVLMQEIHHRVKNNLAIVSSLLSLQAQQSGDAAMRDALGESQRRINSIALIHQLLYEGEDVSRLPFNLYLHRLVDLLISAGGKPTGSIQCLVEAEPLELPLTQAIPRVSK